MSSIKQLCISICAAGIVGSAIQLLAPRRFEKSVRLCVILLTAVAIITVFSNTGADFDITAGLFPESRAYSYSQRGVESGMEFLVMNSLKKSGLSPVAVIYDTNEAESITVIMKPEESPAFILAQRVVQESYGLVAKILIEGG